VFAQVQQSQSQSHSNSAVITCIIMLCMQGSFKLDVCNVEALLMHVLFFDWPSNRACVTWQLPAASDVRQSFSPVVSHYAVSLHSAWPQEGWVAWEAKTCLSCQVPSAELEGMCLHLGCGHSVASCTGFDHCLVTSWHELLPCLVSSSEHQHCMMQDVSSHCLHVGMLCQLLSSALFQNSQGVLRVWLGIISKVLLHF
jgi:hypothetical protein